MKAIAKQLKKETKVTLEMTLVDYLALRDLAGQIQWRRICEPEYTEEHDRIAKEIGKIDTVFK